MPGHTSQQSQRIDRLELDRRDDGYYIESYGGQRVDGLSPEPTVHPSAQLTDSLLGEWTEIRKGCRLHASALDDYTYLMERVQLDYTTIGKFGNVASHARLGPTNHPIDRRLTTSPTGVSRTVSEPTTSQSSSGGRISRSRSVMTFGSVTTRRCCRT
jgi:hypothetical protein